MITSISDYVGKYKLSTGIYDQSKLQDYIDRYEPRYLKSLLGVTLYNEFISDLNLGLPQSPNFVAIYNPFSYDYGVNFYTWNLNYVHSSIIDSEGLKEMLKGFIYFEYSKDLVNEMTPYGNVKPMSENSVVTNTGFSMIYTRYNEALRTYNAIQDYIVQNKSVALGQVVNLSILTNGTGYVLGEFDAIGGTGTGCKVTITETGGIVDTINISQGGQNYVIGDILTIDSGNLDCTFEITYVGIGDYRKFRGVKKLTAYWL